MHFFWIQLFAELHYTSNSDKPFDILPLAQSILDKAMFGQGKTGQAHREKK